jgi:flagellar motor switch protein FliN/FliY
VSDELENLDELLGDNEEPEMSLASPELVEAGDAICQTILSAGAEAWGTLLNRGAFYTHGETQFQEPAELIPAETGAVVLTDVQWTGDREGGFRLVLPALGVKTVVAYFMSLMGVETTPEETELDDEGLDAYAEAVNNFLGQASQALRQDPGGELTLTAGETRVVDLGEEAPAEVFRNDFRVVCSGQLTVEGASPFSVWLILDPALTGVEAAVPSSPEEVAVEEMAGEGGGEEAAAAAAERDPERVKKLPIPVQVTLAEKKERLSVIMNLVPGSIIEFRKSAEELLDLRVGDITIARGEAVIQNERFGLQIRTMVKPKAKAKT